MIVTVLVDATNFVATMKVVVLEPAVTVALGGTVATAVEVLESVTLVPPLAAGPLSVIVAIAGLPPRTALGLNERAVTLGAFTVSQPERVRLLYEAVMLALPEEETGMLVTLKVAVVNPPATVTLSGTVARDVLLLDNLTRMPAVGARPVSVTVPVEELPPTTEVGFSTSELRRGAVTVKVAFRVIAL